MNTREKIEVMQNWVEGRIVEYFDEDLKVWVEDISPCWNWEKWEYRIKPKSTYIPFTFEDRELFRGKWITNEKEGEFFITYIGLEHIGTDSNGYTYQELFENWTFLDGTPCGKLQ